MVTTQSYKDFLLDDDFIRWRLTDDDELNRYWETFLMEHPASEETFQKAIREFSKIRLNNDSLSDIEYNRLRQRIQDSVSIVRKKKWMRRIMQYAAVACIVLIGGFSIYFMPFRMEGRSLLSNGIIVGENLDEKDIYLITGAKTTSFSKDIYVQMDKNGAAVAQETDGGKSTQIETDHTAMNKIVVPYGKRSQLELFDGTKIWINSGSVLEFPAKFTGKTRTVHLVGEIYVEAAKDKQRPFLIQTPDFQIKVYGTKFNVSAYHDNSAQSVVLVEGQVGVKIATHGETLLQPNEMLSCFNDQVSKETVDVTKYTSWRDGYIVLKQTPIADVLKQMERYYNLSFNIQNEVDFQSITCTGKIYLSDNLDNVMKTISLLSSTKYMREDKKIYIDINHLK